MYCSIAHINFEQLITKDVLNLHAELLENMKQQNVQNHISSLSVSDDYILMNVAQLCTFV